MAFLALGINHKTASVDVRERVAFTPEQLVEALQQLCRLTDSREAAILSTCNRSELYIEQDHLSADIVLRWLADYHHLSLEELRASLEKLAHRLARTAAAKTGQVDRAATARTVRGSRSPANPRSSSGAP